jgi:hypothetical protein
MRREAHLRFSERAGVQFPRSVLDYLQAYDSEAESRASIGRYLELFNRRRPHSSLDRRTPDEAYFDPSPLTAAASIFAARSACLRSGYAFPLSRPARNPADHQPGRMQLIFRGRMFKQPEPARSASPTCSICV